MGAFIIRRIAGMILTLVCVITLTFFLIRLAPGGPFDRERKLPEHVEKQLLAKYELDGPLHRQYAAYLWDVIRGDLRISLKYRSRTVNEILAQTLPVSFTLGACAFVVSTVVGMWLGITAAVRRDTIVDRAAMTTAVLAIALPTFVIGPLAILFFALKLQWLPVGGWSGVKSIILPALVLATPYTAYVARLARAGMLEVLQQDFIRTAIAKGLGRPAVVYKHALKPAVLPVISFLGPLAANLLTGSIVVESIFNIPGAGPFFVHSVLNRDSFLLGGVVIVYCSLLVFLNFLVDLTYTFLDRRIRLDG
jgi:oligopeptide transport system permease protein